MWIETNQVFGGNGLVANSFASNGECGLKHSYYWHRVCGGVKFIRQQWRMWIETFRW